MAGVYLRMPGKYVIKAILVILHYGNDIMTKNNPSYKFNNIDIHLYFVNNFHY